MRGLPYLRCGNRAWPAGSHRARSQQTDKDGCGEGDFESHVYPLKLSGMTFRNTTSRWGHVAQSLHWLIVALIITQVILATLAEDLPIGVKKLAMFARHKSVGITILALAVVRVAWRHSNPTPYLPGTLKPYERMLAHLTHAALYLLLFAMPLTGWMMSSARGFRVSWFGFFQLPDFVPQNQALYEVMKATHDDLALALFAVVALHAAAALKHHYVHKDDVLRRMLPFTKTR